jgi:hypothetical protein
VTPFCLRGEQPLPVVVLRFPVKAGIPHIVCTPHRCASDSPLYGRLLLAPWKAVCITNEMHTTLTNRAPVHPPVK